MSRSRLLIVVVVSSIAIHASGQDSKPSSHPAPTVSHATAKEAPQVSVPAFANLSCPVTGKPASMKSFVDTEYGRIYTCCAACEKKIRHDPTGIYEVAYPKTTKVNNAICPVMGNAMSEDQATVLLQGYEVNLCCGEICVAEARANAQTVLVQVLKPKVKIAGNRRCPVTGKAIDKNAVVLIGDSLVNVCSATCVEEIGKAPLEMLEKAMAPPAKKARPAPRSSESETKPDKERAETRQSENEGHDHDRGGCCKQPPPLH